MAGLQGCPEIQPFPKNYQQEFLVVLKGYLALMQKNGTGGESSDRKHFEYKD